MNPEEAQASFEKILSATARSMIGVDAKRDFSLQGSVPPSLLSHQAHALLGSNHEMVRGLCDRIAVAGKYHHPLTHHSYAPADSIARAVYDALEIVRVEYLGGRYLLGAMRNMQQQWLHHCASYVPHYLEASPQQPLMQQGQIPVAEMVRALWLEHIYPEIPIEPSLQPWLKKWREPLMRVMQPYFTALRDAMENPKIFAQEAARLVQRLSTLDGAGEGGAHEQNDGTTQNAQQGAAQNEAASSQPSEAPPEAAEASLDDDGEESLFGRASSTESDAGADGAAEAQMPSDVAGEQPYASSPIVPTSWTAQQEYAIFSTQHDEIIRAEHLASPEELIRLRAELDKKLAQVQGTFARLAARLQRVLMARQIRHWTFDEDDGLIDSSRLAQLICNPLHRHIYKREHDDASKDTIVTLLLDNSGSMRGRPITIAALSSDILVRVLERAGIKVEILGFTTKEWKGGAHYKAWVAAGKPAHPGRLNDLRHIIYKSADMPWRRARSHLGLMLKEGVLKENIDGEALVWAYQRLRARHEERKILMVISDGAPVDDATLSANHPAYLDKHIRSVIQHIQDEGAIELVAIGIGHDVTRYYDRSLCIKDVAKLGETMTNELVSLFS
ncbi:MAG: cobaltochelatase subunit CobT [Alphaproteobacteria bacterium]|nr:MAG: cobaltochelatase subunit CobT [Alphaproteobacteria bacterium]